MKKAVIYISAITAACFLITLIIAQFVNFDMLKDLNINLSESGSIVHGKNKFTIEEKINVENANEIIINVVSQDVLIEASPDEHIYLKLRTSSNTILDISKIMTRQNSQINFNLADFQKGSFRLRSGATNSLSVVIYSSDIVVQVPALIRKIKLQTVSGDAEFQNLKIESVEINSVSGDIEISNSQVHQTKALSISGDIEFKNVTFEKMDLNTTSGDVEFKFTQVPDFSVEMASMSGGLKGDKYFKGFITNRPSALVHGTSDKKISIKTVSGDAEFKKE